MRAPRRRVRQLVTTWHGTGWGTMAGVGQGGARSASHVSRPVRGTSCRRLGRAWALWTSATITVAVGVAGALSFGAAAGSVSVPPSVVLPGTAQVVPSRVSSARAGSLEIVPAIHQVIVQPSEPVTATDGEGTSGEATGGANDSGPSGPPESTANVDGGTTSSAADGSGDATTTGTTAPSDSAPTTGTGDAKSSGSTDAGQSSDGTAAPPTSAPSKESDN